MFMPSFMVFMSDFAQPINDLRPPDLTKWSLLPYQPLRFSFFLGSLFFSVGLPGLIISTRASRWALIWKCLSPCCRHQVDRWYGDRNLEVRRQSLSRRMLNRILTTGWFWPTPELSAGMNTEGRGMRAEAAGRVIRYNFRHLTQCIQFAEEPCGGQLEIREVCYESLHCHYFVCRWRHFRLRISVARRHLCLCRGAAVFILFRPDELNLIVGSSQFSATQDPWLKLNADQEESALVVPLALTQIPSDTSYADLLGYCSNVEARKYELAVENAEWSEYWSSATDRGTSFRGVSDSPSGLEKRPPQYRAFEIVRVRAHRGREDGDIKSILWMILQNRW